MTGANRSRKIQPRPGEKNARLGACRCSDDFRKRCLSDAGRSPEDHGAGIIALDLNFRF